MRRGSAIPELTVEGEGDVVLMLHGLGAASCVFDGVRAQLGPGFRTMTVDLPGHGRAKPWSLLEPRAVAEQLAAVVDAQKFYVVGHSFGGVVALELAALLPTRVRGVLAAGPPALGLGTFRSALDSRFADWTMRIASRFTPSTAAVRAYLKLIWGDGPAPTPGQVQGYLLAMAAEGHHAGTLQALRSLAQYSVPTDALRSAGTSVSLVFGEKDPLVSVAQGRKLAALLNVELDVLAGAGHCIPEEQPKELAAIIRREHQRLLARAG